MKHPTSYLCVAQVGVAARLPRGSREGGPLAGGDTERPRVPDADEARPSKRTGRDQKASGERLNVVGVHCTQENVLYKTCAGFSKEKFDTEGEHWKALKDPSTKIHLTKDDYLLVDTEAETAFHLNFINCENTLLNSVIQFMDHTYSNLTKSINIDQRFSEKLSGADHVWMLINQISNFSWIKLVSCGYTFWQGVCVSLKINDLFVIR